MRSFDGDKPEGRSRFDCFQFLTSHFEVPLDCHMRIAMPGNAAPRNKGCESFRHVLSPPPIVLRRGLLVRGQKPLEATCIVCFVCAAPAGWLPFRSTFKIA